MKKLNGLWIVVLLLAGCRGMESRIPPIQLNLNMDFQQKFDPQEINPLFADSMAMRPLVPGTIARGQLREDTRFYEGKDAGGAYVTSIPVPVTRAVIERGRQRYNVYCTVCHGAVGDGRGIIMTGGYGFTPAPSYHDARLRDVEDGYLYEVIRNGIRTMPAYGPQIPVADRWAIVAYVRALQRSRNAVQADVPANILSTLTTPATTPDTTAPATGAETTP